MNLTPESIRAFPVLDSRGNWTVGVGIKINGTRATAMVPSGASTGKKEAKELRDTDGGVSQAIANVTEIAQGLSGYNIRYQKDIDTAMCRLDGTSNKGRLGANAILGVSLAVAKACALLKGVELYEQLAELYGEPKPTLLPTPMMNLINGGRHANNGLVLQEFMIVPTGTSTFSEALNIGASIYRVLGKEVHGVGVGDEGGYAPQFANNETIAQDVNDALSMLLTSVDKAGYIPGRDVNFAIDAAASIFFKRGGYDLGQTHYTPGELVRFYKPFLNDYPVVSLEDGAAEDDDVGWKALTEAFGKRLQLIGDDRFVTNPQIFAEGIKRGDANAILIKPNQIGTLTETLDVIRMARSADYNVVISHRSGETEDTFIADLAVAVRAGQVKTGSPARGERTAKYNRLLSIERELGSRAEYAGENPYLRFRGA